MLVVYNFKLTKVNALTALVLSAKLSASAKREGERIAGQTKRRKTQAEMTCSKRPPYSFRGDLNPSEVLVGIMASRIAANVIRNSLKKNS